MSRSPRYRLSPITRRALEILKRQGNLDPDQFYPVMWPEGRYASNPGTIQGGGPSKAAVASNWYLGRLQRKGLVSKIRESASPRFTHWTLTRLGASLIEPDPRQRKLRFRGVLAFPGSPLPSPLAEAVQ